MDTEKKKINQELSNFNKHLRDCDVLDKGAVLISFFIMLKYVFLNISHHTRKNISYIFNKKN